MSFKGQVEVQCPAGCEPFEAEVWTILRVDQDPDIKEKLMAGELNLLMCPSCNRYFIQDQPIVYNDPPRELLAFIFPEYFKEEEERWRAKMREEYEQMKSTSGSGSADYEPGVYFGLEAFRQILDQENNLEDEVEIAKLLARSLHLALYPVRPSYARAHKIPPLLPYQEDLQGDMKAKIVAGLSKLLGENEFLTSYQRGLIHVQAAQEAPPRRLEA